MKENRLQVFDCTIRDGGIMNKWQFSHETVRELYLANTLAGVDYMEMGYKASPAQFSPLEFGPWRFCNEEDLERVTGGIPSDLKLSMMVDIGRCSEEDILPAAGSLINTIRIACYIHQADEAIAMAGHCVAMGYECFINIMAVSTVENSLVEEFLHRIERETAITGVYVSDTFGSFTFRQVESLVHQYRDICKTKSVGFHGHNNQQLALANTLLALGAGAVYLDGSCFGMGRGAGNTPLELLLPQLKQSGYTIEPILKVIEAYIEPLIKQYKWGYHIPYAVTGITNNHPRAAMDFINNNDSGYDSFYSAMNL